MKKLRKKYSKLLDAEAKDWDIGAIDFSFSESDIMDPSGDLKHTQNLLLGYYQKEIIDVFFRRYKIAGIFKTLGIPDIQVKLDLDDPYLHKFYIYSEKLDDEHKIVEIFLRKKSLKIPSEKNPDKRAELLYVDWLMMQNPFKSFSKQKPRLPGQNYPGLRIGSHILEILYHTADRIHLEGLANSPNYLHTAVLFSKDFKFIDPKMQAISEAVKGYLLKRYSFWTVAWASVHGAILYKDSGKEFHWESSPMVLPISHKMKQYFSSKWYKQEYRKFKDEFRVEIDFDILSKKLDENKSNV